MIIYFIRAKEFDYVKIGKTNNVLKRLAALQCGTPHTLEIVREIEGPPAIERAAHRRFNKHHIRGEWFQFVEEMLVWEPHPDEIKAAYPGNAPPPLQTARWPRSTPLDVMATQALYPESMDADEVRSFLRQVVNGNVQGWAKANGISPGYVADVLRGRKLPGEKVLTALHLRRGYELKQPGEKHHNE